MSTLICFALKEEAALFRKIARPKAPEDRRTPPLLPAFENSPAEIPDPEFASVQKTTFRAASRVEKAFFA